jgi:hypothetical protein
MKTAIRERGNILSNRVKKLNIIRNDIYPNHFNRINRLIIKTERKLLIISKILNQ